MTPTHLAPILLQQGFQVGEQGRTELRMPETELDAGGNEAGGITEVMADAIVDYNVDGVAPETRNATASISCSSPTLAESNTAESTKNRAVQKAATGSHQIRRRIPNRRLIHHAHNLLHPIIVGSLHIKDAIIRHLQRLHLYRQQHRTTMLSAHPNHLPHGRGGLNSPIGKHDRGIVSVGI